MERIKHYIDLLSKKRPKKDQVLKYLAEAAELDDERRNLIYFYFFPRNLLDMELPSRLMTYRGENNKNGYLEPNLVETGLLLEAYRTPQYNRYMRHLLHSYHDPSLVFPLAGHGKGECGLCKKGVWQQDEWENILNQYPEQAEEREKKEFLAYGTDSSKICLCLPCLIQLATLHKLLQTIEGDEYLNWKVNNWSKKVKTRFAGPVGLDSDSDV